MEYHGISWNIMEYHGISWNNMEYRGITWNIMEYHGISWNSVEYHGIAWNIMEYHGISWNNVEYRGISWNIVVNDTALTLPGCRAPQARQHKYQPVGVSLVCRFCIHAAGEDVPIRCRESRDCGKAYRIYGICVEYHGRAKNI